MGLARVLVTYSTSPSTFVFWDIYLRGQYLTQDVQKCLWNSRIGIQVVSVDNTLRVVFEFCTHGIYFTDKTSKRNVLVIIVFSMPCKNVSDVKFLILDHVTWMVKFSDLVDLHVFVPSSMNHCSQYQLIGVSDPDSIIYRSYNWNIAEYIVKQQNTIKPRLSPSYLPWAHSWKSKKDPDAKYITETSRLCLVGC